MRKLRLRGNTCLHCTMAIYSNARALDGHVPSGGGGGGEVLGSSLPSEACAPRQLEDSALCPNPLRGPLCPFQATGLPKSDFSGKCQSASDLLPTGPAGPVGAERHPRPTDRQGQAQVSPVRGSGQGPGHGHWPWLAPDYVSCRAFHLSLSPLGPGQNSFPFRRANDLLFPCLLP